MHLETIVPTHERQPPQGTNTLPVEVPAESDIVDPASVPNPSVIEESVVIDVAEQKMGQKFATLAVEHPEENAQLI